MKQDEVKLLRELAKLGQMRDEFATAVGIRLCMHEKRVAYILEKWSDKGWWMYGVSLRTGWLTEKGLEAARENGAIALRDR